MAVEATPDLEFITVENVSFVQKMGKFPDMMGNQGDQAIGEQPSFTRLISSRNLTRMPLQNIFQFFTEII